MLKSLKIKLLAGVTLLVGLVGTAMAATPGDIAIVQCYANESGVMAVKAASFSNTEHKAKSATDCAQLLSDLESAGYIGVNEPAALDAAVVYTLIVPEPSPHN